ncbi:chemotaxis protein CheC [Aeribacillus sp. FSL K6-1121]|uniref:chemotaxis protein CheC n=1 Tax=Aeribacillus sp. FSL K6-1121 TaxID=2954745 RepID=UPI0030F66822
MSKLFDLSNKRIDILKEIANIGAGNAATSLSQLLSKKIEMKVPNVYVASFNDVMDLAGGAETEVTAVYIRIQEDITGSMFFILPIPQAKKYAKALMNDYVLQDASTMKEMECSVLQELGNILIGSYLSVLSNMTNLMVNPSVPAIQCDMFGAIISHALIELSLESDEALVIDAVIKEEGHQDSELIRGHIFFLPDSQSYKKIFDILEV